MNAQKTKILIIDDDARNIFALRAVLKSKGFECITASSAEEGIKKALAANVGIILMDMMMPGTDGYEAISRIRNIPEITAVPIIAVTAQAMKGDREKCLQAGADGYISKPIDVDQLLNLLRKSLV